MRRVLAPLLLLCAAAAAGDLTLNDVFGRPGGALPRAFQFSPDASRLAYLLERKNRLSDLWEIDLAGGKARVLIAAKGRQKLTKEQQAARERRRERAFGVTSYQWRPKSSGILVPRSGDLYLWRNGKLERLTETKPPERKPRWSPDGRAIAYVRDKNLHVLDVETGKERMLTRWGKGNRNCGLADFIAGEELGRHDGFWWSDDSRFIAYVRFDLSLVPRFRIPKALDVRGMSEVQEYPRAGDPNAPWWLHVIDVASGQDIQIPVANEYLVR
ncbi:MAG: DPP IV N-terminal domain-containing protein, partial [Planctomycetota bacterium]